MDTYESNIDPKISNGDEKKNSKLGIPPCQFCHRKKLDLVMAYVRFFHNKSKSNITMRKPMKISSK